MQLRLPTDIERLQQKASVKMRGADGLKGIGNGYKPHLGFLDSFRGVAIFSVFIYHALGAAFGIDQLPWNHWFRDFTVPVSFLMLLPATLGWAGVAVFFVVSGFCVHLSFSRSGGSWLGFFNRRFFRIYPPYLVILLLFALLFPTTHLPVAALFSWADTGSHLLLLHNWSFSSFLGINPSFWTIAVEAQLYAIYPLLIIVVRKIGWKNGLLLVGVIEFALRGWAGAYLVMYGQELPKWVSGSPLIFWFSWSIGAAVADAFLQGRALPFRDWPPVLLLISAIGTYFVRPLYPFSFVFFALLTACMISRKLSMPSAQAAVRVKHLLDLGVCSYSFYLIHQPLVVAVPRTFQKLHLHVPSFMIFLLCLSLYPAIFWAAKRCYQYLELPSVLLGKRAYRF